MNNGIILYIGGFELPDKNAAAHRVLGNAKWLRDSGYTVVLAGLDRDLDRSVDVMSTRSAVQGFDCYALPYPKSARDWMGYLRSIAPYVRLCEAYPSVKAVIGYNFPSLALQKLRRYTKSRGILCVADVTEWYSMSGRGFPMNLIKGLDTWYRMRFVHKRMDGLIVISRYLQEYYKAHSHVICLPPLTDRQEDKWRSQAPDKPRDELRLVYAGNPGRKDRIDVLIEALQTVSRRYRLDVIGITKEQYLELYPRHRAFLDEKPAITFYGRLGHLETLAFIRVAHYSCFFREDDRVSRAGFPTKLAEAITCGTPVITNPTSDIADYLHDGENGFLAKDLSPKTIASLIENVPFSLPVDRDLFDYRRVDARFLEES